MAAKKTPAKTTEKPVPTKKRKEMANAKPKSREKQYAPDPRNYIQVKQPDEQVLPENATPFYDSLEPRMQRFVDEYLLDLNGTQAAIRARYSVKTACEQAARLLTNPKVKGAIEEMKAARRQRVQLTADDVLRELKALFFADVNELVEYVRNACRYCWGDGYEYQRTDAEMMADREKYELERAEAIARTPALIETYPSFKERGGVGFDVSRDPNPECPECRGEGLGRVLFKDTRNLSRAARFLYAGAKISKDGIEIKTYSKEKVWEILCKHLGIYEDRTEVNFKFDAAEMDQKFRETMERAKKRAAEVRATRNLPSED